MVVLDSDHSYGHVLCRMPRLRSAGDAGLLPRRCRYGRWEHVGEDQSPKKRSKSWFRGNDPLTALNDYLKETDRFEVDPVINGKLVLASSPGGYCVRLPDPA